MFSNVSIIPIFVSVMSKTVKPSCSFPVIESAVADSITHTTVRSLWGNDFLFETKYEKKTKRYYLCYNISGKFFKLSKIKR